MIGGHYLCASAIAALKATQRPKSKTHRQPMCQCFSRLPVTFLLPPLRLGNPFSVRCKMSSDFRLRVFPPSGLVSLTFSLPLLQLPNQFATQSEKRSAAAAGHLFVFFFLSRHCSCVNQLASEVIIVSASNLNFSHRRIGLPFRRQYFEPPKSFLLTVAG